jgi:hypothetical protein
MEEDLLPAPIRAKASISVGGEHAWRKIDIADVIAAARLVGLAPSSGQAQFQFPDGTCEPYWLDYHASAQLAHEAWPAYVQRSADELTAQFNALCATTDFVQAAMEWDFIRRKVQANGINPLDYLWFVLYFASEL